jgi:hypothetical protein
MSPADRIWSNHYDWYLASEGWAFSREAAFDQRQLDLPPH